MINSSFFSNLALHLLGFKINTNKFSKFEDTDNYLIVSNHLSYMDMFILSSKMNCVYIAAKDGAQEQFPLSWITKNSGGIFIDRRNKGTMKEEILKIKDVLNNGFNVVLYPEGTTSDGSKMLKFRSPFFSVVYKSELKILPVCINYKKINGETVTNKNRSLVCFAEDISFFKHFFRLLTLKRIDALISFLDIVDPKEYKSRKEISEITFNKINEFYKSELMN